MGDQAKYSIFASKTTDCSKTSKALERFEVREEAGLDGAAIELALQGYKIHGVLGKGFDETGRPSDSRRPGRH